MLVAVGVGEKSGLAGIAGPNSVHVLAEPCSHVFWPDRFIVRFVTLTLLLKMFGVAGVPPVPITVPPGVNEFAPSENVPLPMLIVPNVREPPALTVKSRFADVTLPRLTDPPPDKSVVALPRVAPEL